MTPRIELSGGDKTAHAKIDSSINVLNSHSQRILYLKIGSLHALDNCSEGNVLKLRALVDDFLKLIDSGVFQMELVADDLGDVSVKSLRVDSIGLSIDKRLQDIVVL